MYEDRAGKIEKAEASYQSEKLMTVQYFTELETLRKKATRYENEIQSQ